MGGTPAPLSNRRDSDASTPLLEIVEAVRSIPYGRARDRSVMGMLRENCGTCSTKHEHLYAVLRERFPETDPRIVHRVYRLSRSDAERRFGMEVAGAVPDNGLVDVHRYLTAAISGSRVTLDVTFPGQPWDGISPLPLACGEGEDHPAGTDPNTEKRALEQRFCDPRLREPFIHALSARQP